MSWVVMMIIVLLIVWGGFVWCIKLSADAEKKKGHL